MNESPLATNALSDLDPKAASGSFELFGEVADTLLYWVSELHARLGADSVEEVYFLSREGQPLKKMFDRYCALLGVPIKSRYLQVSRRSTLLPSLDALDEERFETLFRQYRCMSLSEFLSSLGLEEFGEELSILLSLSTDDYAFRHEEFPLCDVFLRLKALPRFISLYDEERLSRRAAFVQYFSELSEGHVPEHLAIVDVGWKGTIQDNLYSLLCRGEQSPVKSISGYYIGLVAPGAAHSLNRKYGLLFSSLSGRTPRFHVFNENRALFEILMAADHGSAASYKIDPQGKPSVMHDIFHEQEMLESRVFPVQRHIFARYNQLLTETSWREGAKSQRLRRVARSHARMVFQPSEAEMSWFASVFHLENYGVFELSHFSRASNAPNFSDRVKFLFTVLRRNGRGLLGFWPWMKLDERVGRSVANLYGLLRYLQK